ncbi:hypothetical protein GUJ93_ZPchr0010g9369 [Zizania palustris]|uniref:Uncharacterized protein n=1 Tax=Zizania palustris TaxID=103762 RepID=A0A8J6BDQ8_ZIZPA|nr:hypothetical protein GUJ93_ZPchr0010g9369 [Zizania palustris]
MAARVASSSFAALMMMAQRGGLSSAAITAAEGSTKIIEDKAVKLGTVAKDVAAAMATTTEEKTAFWEPDPETGYYRPVTGTKEVDAADLRAEMLKQRMLHD